MSDPRLQQLASEAASKIKVITDERDDKIQQVYQDYREQAASIRAEVTSQDLNRLTDDSGSEPHPQQSIKH